MSQTEVLFWSIVLCSMYVQSSTEWTYSQHKVTPCDPSPAPAELAMCMHDNSLALHCCGELQTASRSKNSGNTLHEAVAHTHTLLSMHTELCTACRGSDLSEACAAGCAVVTGSNSKIYTHAADINQAALRSEQVQSPLSQQGLSEQDGTERSAGPRCQNPTPRHAAG